MGSTAARGVPARTKTLKSVSASKSVKERKSKYLKSVVGLIYMSRLLRRWGYGSAIVGDNPTSISLGLTDGSEFIGSTQGKYVPCCSGIVLINSGLVPSSGLYPRWASSGD